METQHLATAPHGYETDLPVCMDNAIGQRHRVTVDTPEMKGTFIVESLSDHSHLREGTVAHGRTEEGTSMAAYFPVPLSSYHFAPRG